MKKAYLIVIGLLVVFALYGFATYNGLVTSNEQITNQWAQVETQYQRRFDLIPQLVGAVKGVMGQEQKIFGEIADARTHYAGAQTVDEKAQAAGEVDSAFSRLLVIMENYPQLKSADNVLALQSQIEGTENRISVERKRFNDLVQSYNLKVKRIPSSIVARMAGFDEHAYFEIADGTDAVPTVQF